MGAQKHNNLPCRIPYELLTERLIRGEEVQRPEFLGKKNLGYLTNIFMVHPSLHTWPTKHVSTCQAHTNDRTSPSRTAYHSSPCTYTHMHTHWPYPIYPTVCGAIHYPWPDTRPLVTVSHPAIRRWVPGHFLYFTSYWQKLCQPPGLLSTNSHLHTCIWGGWDHRFICKEKSLQESN